MSSSAVVGWGLSRREDDRAVQLTTQIHLVPKLRTNVAVFDSSSKPPRCGQGQLDFFFLVPCIVKILICEFRLLVIGLLYRKRVENHADGMYENRCPTIGLHCKPVAWRRRTLYRQGNIFHVLNTHRAGKAPWWARRDDGWGPEFFWTWWRRRKCLPLPGAKHRSSSQLPSHCTELLRHLQTGVGMAVYSYCAAPAAAPVMREHTPKLDALKCSEVLRIFWRLSVTLNISGRYLWFYVRKFSFLS